MTVTKTEALGPSPVVSVVDELVERSARQSARALEDGAAGRPGLKALVVTCVDPRVDPAHIFALQPGEAAVLRNAGGRITPGTLQTLAVLAEVSAVQGLGRSELVIMHHTDCGLSRLGDPQYEQPLAAYFGVEAGGLGAKHLDDPVASVRADLELLRANERMPRETVVSGLVYDVATRRARIIVPPAPLGQGGTP